MDTAAEGRVECESSVHVPIDREVYRELAHAVDRIDTILYFEQPTLRLSARRFETKTVTSRKQILEFVADDYEGFASFIPVNRTRAIEKLQSLRNLTPKDLKTRVVIYRKILSARSSGNGGFLRVSLNRRMEGRVTRYSLDFEIEYAASATYSEICEYEFFLLQQVAQYGYGLRTHVTNINLIFTCIPVKLQLWHIFRSSKAYTCAPKWNGLRARLMLVKLMGHQQDEFGAYLCPDNGALEKCKVRIAEGGVAANNALNLLCNLGIIVELMTNGRLIVFEICGMSFDTSRESIEKFYHSEPSANVRMLSYFSRLLAQSEIWIGSYRLFFQQFRATNYAELLNNYCAEDPDGIHVNQPRIDSLELDCDGVVIAQENYLIKWKVPTIDAMCLEPGKFGFGLQTQQAQPSYAQIAKFHNLKSLSEPSAVYEFDMNFTLLRKRTDRFCADSDTEFRQFLMSREMFRENEKRANAP